MQVQNTKQFRAKVFDDFGGFTMVDIQATSMIDAQYLVAEKLKCDPDMVWVLTNEESAQEPSRDFAGPLEPTCEQHDDPRCDCEDYPCCGH